METEFLIALDIQRILEAAGTGQMMFARSAGEAGALSHRWHEIDLAIIDVSYDSDPSVALGQALQQAGIALVLSTSEVRHRHGLKMLQGVPVIVKPFPEDELLAACRAALEGQHRLPN